VQWLFFFSHLLFGIDTVDALPSYLVIVRLPGLLSFSRCYLKLSAQRNETETKQF